MLLRHGDLFIMDGQDRSSLHAVPRVLTRSESLELDSHWSIPIQNLKLKNYLDQCRININIRQVNSWFREEKNVFFRYILWVRMIDRKRNWKNKLKKLQNRSKRKVRNQRLRFDYLSFNLAAEASEANASEEATDDQAATQGIYYIYTIFPII